MEDDHSDHHPCGIKVVVKKKGEEKIERGEEVSEWTNLQNKGLISVDRRTKPTLVLTIPRSY